ncbi:MAG: sterol desaturase family protein [Chitinophagaceae bacterium]
MLQQFIQHFQTLEQRPLERAAYIVLGMLVLWMIEAAIPFIEMHYKRNKLKHASVNLGFTAIHLIFHTFFAIIIVAISNWCASNSFGVVYWINASPFVTIIIAALIIDFFVGWLVHMLEHQVPFMWHFHVIHHADNNVDVTSGLRHHPIESIFRGIFIFMGVALSGAPMYAVMMYQTLLVLATAFTHANILLPLWVEKWLSYIIVTPAMHKVHHHFQQPYTDSNYGAVFAIWDRFLGTWKHLDKQQIQYGLDRYYPNHKDEEFITLMKYPFTKHT